MYSRFGEFVAKRWPWVLLAWLALAGTTRWLAPAWDQVTRDGDLAYLPPSMTSVRGQQLLEEAFPDQRSRSQFVLVLEREGEKLGPKDFLFAHGLAERFAVDGDHGLPIVDVWDSRHPLLGSKLVSRDGRATMVVLLTSPEFASTSHIASLAEVEKTLENLRSDEETPEGLRLGVTGSAAIGGDMLSAAAESIRNTEWATITLVLVILLLVYRAPLLALVPLLTLVAAVSVSTSLVSLLTQVQTNPGWEWFDYKVFKTTRIFIVVVLFGSGTDFCLFLIARYKENLETGLAPASAVAASLGQVGEALVASALTTILGLATMFFAEFGKYRNSGPTIALCLAITLLACMTLAPALLRAFGAIVFWPRPPRFARAKSVAQDEEQLATSGEDRATSAPAARFWTWLARIVVARPGMVLIAAIVPLSPLAWRGLSVEVSYDLLQELPPDRASRKGTELLRRHFPAGDTGSITILARDDGFDFDTPEGKRRIETLSEILLEELRDGQTGRRRADSRVLSLTRPLGDSPKGKSVLTPAGLMARALPEQPRVKRAFLAPSGPHARHVTRFDVIGPESPFSLAAARLLDRLEARLDLERSRPDSPWREATFEFVGPTAGARDLRVVTERDRVRIQWLTVIAVSGVLLATLRRPVFCLFLIASVLFSYFVTIGATEWLFRSLYDPFDGLDWKAPIFLFVILIAVGEDYNIYLATRIFEEQRRLGPKAGLQEAIVRTGGIITSCGVIMAGTFCSLMLGTLRGMLELGFALSLGVMLDTFIVRPVLAPAFLAWTLRWRKS